MGYVEKEENVYFFALNIEADESTVKDASGAKAKELAMYILHDKGILTD